MSNIDMQVYNDILQKRLGALEMDNIGLSAHVAVLTTTVEQQNETIHAQAEELEQLKADPPGFTTVNHEAVPDD